MTSRRTERSDRSPESITTSSPPAAREAVRERRLLRAARRGDRGARDRLVLANLGLVRAVASRYRDLGLPLDDLLQEGSLGLLDAIDRYDPCRGADFTAFARFRVRRAIRNALTDQARLIRLPKQIVERRRAIERAAARLASAAGGRRPTPEQIAAATGLSVAAVLEARVAALAPISLDGPLVHDASESAPLVADPAAPDPEAEALEQEQRELLRAALAGLPERQRLVVLARWDLGQLPASASAVAAELELSPRRTQTIAADALVELRAALTEASR